MKTNQHNAGHMTKMAPMSIYGKHFKNILSRKEKTHHEPEDVVKTSSTP